MEMDHPISISNLGGCRLSLVKPATVVLVAVGLLLLTVTLGFPGLLSVPTSPTSVTNPSTGGSCQFGGTYPNCYPSSPVTNPGSGGSQPSIAVQCGAAAVTLNVPTSVTVQGPSGGSTVTVTSNIPVSFTLCQQGSIYLITVTMPTSTTGPYASGLGNYIFGKWEDGSTNPSRYYTVPAPPPSSGSVPAVSPPPLLVATFLPTNPTQPTPPSPIGSSQSSSSGPSLLSMILTVTGIALVAGGGLNELIEEKPRPRRRT